jgi:hypothetical protein
MKEKKEKIDLLFERNAAEQLAGIDWEGLNRAISGQLDQGDQQKSSVVRYRRIIKSAAALAAAAVVLIAVMVGTDRRMGVQLEEGGGAVVKFIKAEGSAVVEIKQVSAKARVVIDIGRGERKVAICDVKITDLNGDLKKEVDRASSWIIISRPEPVFAHNGNNRDIMSMICLF